MTRNKVEKLLPQDSQAKDFDSEMQKIFENRSVHIYPEFCQRKIFKEGN